jgi:hypothetical protein
LSSVSKVLALAPALAGAAAVLALTGCSLPNVTPNTPVSGTASATPSASASASGSPATPVAGTAPMSPVPAATGQLTGTQLQTVLLPQSSFPAGFTPTSGAVNSGSALSSSPAQYDLATVSCATFVNHLGNTGFGETAMASNGFADKSQGFDQVVYQFGSAGAASGFVSGIKALAGRCHAFTATDNGATGRFSLSAAAGPAIGGHPSLRLAQTGTIAGSSVVLDTLLSASGVDVFAGAAAGVGTSAPTSVATPTIVYNLMKRQAAAALLG